MSTNCLVTKLRGVVENSNVPYFGEIRFNFRGSQDSNPQNISVISYTEETVVRIVSPSVNFVKSDGTSWGVNVITVPIGSSLSALGYYLPADYVGEIIVTSKYDFGAIVLASNTRAGFSIADIKYSTSLATINLGNNGENVLGDISNIPGSVTSLTAKYSALSGSIENLNTKDITTLLVQSSANISGTIEGFATHLISLGRTSGSITITANNTGITYNGNAISSGNHTLTFSGGSYTFE